MKYEIVKPNRDTSFYRVCIFGDPNSGKTVLAAKSPDPIIMDFENNGSKTLVQFLPDAKIVHVRTYADGEGFFWALRKKEFECETIVIDTVSTLHDRLLTDSVDAFAKRENRAKDAMGTNIIPYQGDYRYAMEGVKRLIEMFETLPINIVLVAHSLMEEEKMSEVKYTRPSLPPKLYSVINAKMDLVAHVDGKFINGVFKQTVTTVPTGAIKAKNRLYSTATKLVNPTWNQLLGKE